MYGHNIIGNEDRIEVPVNVDDEEDSEEDFDVDGRRRVRDLQDSGDESYKEINESDNDAAIDDNNLFDGNWKFKLCESKTNWRCKINEYKTNS